MKKLEPSHHGVRATAEERRIVQLWLDSGAPYPGTYAALGCGMIGGYQKNKQVLENDEAWPESKAAQAAMAQRCAGCHTGEKSLPKYLSDENELSFWQPKMDDPRLKWHRHIVFNLTRPEKSLMLLAPLAKAAGGYGLCRKKDAPAEAAGGVFAGRDDADYQKILAMCEAGRRRLEAIKRFDMPGFRPRPEYVREMKRYGVLPAAFDLSKEALDVYATDRKYWDSFAWEARK